ncbi:MAG TPA: chromate transporter, partial [Polyangiaceae bacterium]|nr:chromate transporter [Polyangiaceae bacterium]
VFVLAAAGALAAAAPAGGSLPSGSPDPPDRPDRPDSAPAWVAAAAAATAGAATAPVGLGPLFLVFLKVGSLVFGSGYVLLAFLRSDLVDRLHWLTEAQLVDAVAVGQVTPGPVFTTATFIGYLLAGAPGAALATLGIFLPSFVLVAVSGRLLPRVRRSPMLGRVLDGINVASLALMALVTAQIAWPLARDPRAVAIAAAAAVLLWRWRVSSLWIVLGGAGIGALLRVGG